MPTDIHLASRRRCIVVGPSGRQLECQPPSLREIFTSIGLTVRRGRSCCTVRPITSSCFQLLG